MDQFAPLLTRRDINSSEKCSFGSTEKDFSACHKNGKCRDAPRNESKRHKDEKIKKIVREGYAKVAKKCSPFMVAGWVALKKGSLIV